MPTAIPTEYLEINSYPLGNAAVRLTSLRPLWKVLYRTSEAVAPYVDGEQSYPSRLAALRVALPGVLWGHVDSDGDPTASIEAGLLANYEELYAAVLAPVSTGDGTRAATWHRGTGAEWTGTAKVLNFDVRELAPRSVRFTLSLLIPAGRLTAP